jgi:murein DD-endopeptidase MepM/ murein hydrolase activator NlpD
MKRAADIWNSLRQHIKKGMLAYSAFMEKQGFYLVLTICVLVIVGTAVWTRATRTPEPPPAQENGQAADMPYEGVQRLSDMTMAPSPTRLLPTPTPIPSLPFLRPVPGAVSRAFDATRPVFFIAAGIWQLHSACDYLAKTGDVVKSMGDGTVIGISDSGLLGKTVTIQHDRGIVALYGGLSMNSYVKLGDPVKCDQVIGHAGNSTLFETDDGPHLHLFVTKDGHPVDPEELFTSNIE